ncbi:MAG: RIP metalloprotease [Hyphomicrobiales bacterium]|nr:RIP metalloprotease [Hyphomicrobiales bacterium]
MEIIAKLAGFGDTFLSYLWYLPPFLFVLTVVVFFHELGHFLVARWCGVTVKTFSIGFGKEIFGFNDRKGTRWRLSWIPLGGYVKFLDDENAASVPDRAALEAMTEEERAGAFQDKPLAHRAAVVAAGPIANFLLAIVIFAFMFTFIGQRTTAPRVDAITPGGAAAEAGFQTGDLVTDIDGEPIESFGEMQRIVSESADKTLRIVVLRGDTEIVLEATPKLKEIKDRFGTRRHGLLGIRRSASPDDWILQKHDPFTATWMATKETYFVVSRTLVYLYRVIIGREPADQLGGPLRIAQVSGEVANLGFLPLLNLAAILSVSIGLINLFPIPMLDGGHLMFYGIEAVRGRPLSERSQEIGFRIGLAVVLMLMIFATWNDLIHFSSL